MLGFRVGYWSRCQRRRFAGGASVRGGQCLAVVPASLIRCHANSSVEPDRHYAAGTRPRQSLSSWTDGRLFLSVQSALGGRGNVLGPSRQTLRDNKKRPMQLRAARVGCRTFVLRTTGGGAARPPHSLAPSALLNFPIVQLPRISHKAQSNLNHRLRSNNNNTAGFVHRWGGF